MGTQVMMPQTAPRRTQTVRSSREVWAQMAGWMHTEVYVAQPLISHTVLSARTWTPPRCTMHTLRSQRCSVTGRPGGTLVLLHDFSAGLCKHTSAWARLSWGVAGKLE